MPEGEPKPIEQQEAKGPEPAPKPERKRPSWEEREERAAREMREREQRARDIAERERIAREELLTGAGEPPAEETATQAAAAASLVTEAYPFGKTEGFFIRIGIPASEQEGDGAGLAIINREGDEVLNLRDLVPAGTEFAASRSARVPEYDYEQNRVYLPVLSKKFVRESGKKFLGILHAVGHARRRGEPDEERAQLLTLRERDAYDKMAEGGTEEARREYERISAEAKEARKKSEEEAWQEALGIIEKYQKEKGLDLVPGYGELKEGEAVKQKVWQEIQRHAEREETFGAGGETFGERLRALFTREGLKRGLRQSKQILKKVAVGAVVAAVVAGAVIKWSFGFLRTLWSEAEGGAGGSWKAWRNQVKAEREKKQEPKK